MTLCDASPLIALFNNQDENHERCIECLPELSHPLVTTIPCYTEALYLLGKRGGWLGQKMLWDFVLDNLLHLHFSDKHQINRAYTLMSKYADVPMDFWGMHPWWSLQKPSNKPESSHWTEISISIGFQGTSLLKSYRDCNEGE